jgi:hypothetical protein
MSSSRTLSRPRGNHRIFDGLWESNDFYAQSVVDALYAARSSSWAPALLQSVIALLVLSEAIAGRRGLPRYISGAANAKGEVRLPSKSRMQAMMRAVTFSRNQLFDTGVDIEALQPFVFDLADRSCLRRESQGSSRLQCRPILRVRNGSFVVALPTAIGASIRYLVLRQLDDNSLRAFYGALRNVQVAAALRCPLMSGAERDPKAPVILGADQPIDVFSNQIDSCKIALVVMLHDNPSAGSEVALDDAWRLFDDLVTKLEDNLRSAALRASVDGPITSVLVIVVPCGIGRGFAMPMPNLGDPWSTYAFGLSDLISFSRARRASLLALHKLAAQRSWLSERGIHLRRHDTHLNLYAFWTANNFTLLHSEMDLSTGPIELAILSDHVAKLRQETRRAYDEHAVHRSQRDSWLMIRRVWPFDQLDRASSRVFGSTDYAAEDVLLGIVAFEHAWLHVILDCRALPGTHRGVLSASLGSNSSVVIARRR